MTNPTAVTMTDGWVLDGIPDAELDRRVAQTRERMQAEGIDLLLCYADCWRVANVAYFTDFRPIDGIHEHASALFCLPASGDPVLLVGSTCVDFARSTTRFAVEDFSDMKRVLSRMNVKSDTVAIAGRRIMATWLSDALTDHFGPGLRSTDVLAVQKSKKSAWEVARLSRAARLADIGLEAIRDQLQTVGSTSERDLARIADQAMIQEGADGVGYLSMVQSGPRSAFQLALPSDRMVVPGDLVMTDIGARYRGYVADGGRGFGFGPLSDRQRDILETAADAVQAGLDRVAVGIEARELNAAIQDVLVERGFADFSSEARGHGTGHGTGMDPEEELPWIRPSAETLLEVDMVFTLKATITVPNVGGLRMERIVWIGPDGPVALDQFPMRNYW
jgi:Xaa-Pro dipeptidase